MFDRFFATSPAGGRGKRAGGPGQALKGVIALLDNRDNRQYRTFDLRRAEAHRIEGYAVVFNVPTVLDRDLHSGAEFREVIQNEKRLPLPPAAELRIAPPTWGGYDPSFSAAGQDTLSVFGEKAFPLPLDPSVFCSDAPVQDGQ